MSPGEHYAEAARLMAKVADLGRPDHPASIGWTEQAQVHATLAGCTTEDYLKAKYPVTENGHVITALTDNRL